MKKYLLKLYIISISLLLMGCPDDDEFDINFKIINETPNKIYIIYDHQVDFNPIRYRYPSDSIAGMGMNTYATQSEWYETQANRWAWRYANKHGFMNNCLYPNDKPLR